MPKHWSHNGTKCLTWCKSLVEAVAQWGKSQSAAGLLISYLSISVRRQKMAWALGPLPLFGENRMGFLTLDLGLVQTCLLWHIWRMNQWMEELFPSFKLIHQSLKINATCKGQLIFRLWMLSNRYKGSETEEKYLLVLTKFCLKLLCWLRSLKTVLLNCYWDNPKIWFFKPLA